MRFLPAKDYMPTTISFIYNRKILKSSIREYFNKKMKCHKLVEPSEVIKGSFGTGVSNFQIDRKIDEGDMIG